MKKADELHRKWLRKPGYRKAYDALAGEFDIASALIEARSKADMTQEEVAKRMKTSQSFVARLEGGTVTPTIKSLQRYAKATGTRLKIALESSTVH